MNKKFKLLIKILVACLVFFAIAVCYFFIGSPPVAQKIVWGVDFSQMQAETLGLNWKEAYLSMINDLGTKNIKLHTQWDWVEGQKSDYYFEDIDWQIKKAEQNNVKIIFVIGIKTGRWPECHIPIWANDLSENEIRENALKYINQVVLRYKDSPAISYWQVENEPFFKFGECPKWYYNSDEFLKQEVAVVKSLDTNREVIVSDSGEQSFWLKAGKIGDIVGITMYRKAWFGFTNIGFNFDFVLMPVSYFKKAEIIKKIYNKKTICIELQAEPWTAKPYVDISVSEQLKTMNLNQFKKNVEYAKKTGIDTFYFWGAEWWYWLKTTQNQPEIWNEAKNLFEKND